MHDPLSLLLCHLTTLFTSAMATTSNSMSGRNTELHQTKLVRDDDEQKQIRSENHKLRRVSVLYYLSRNGSLDHPHFMEVPLSSPHGLFLSDVINRLNLLRGKAMASMYSWSCKRRYKNGFVWHDLSDNDFIYPAHGNEYVLKGSELPEDPFPFPFPAPKQRGRRNHYCSSTDFDNSTLQAEVSTQTEEPKEEDEIEVSTPPSNSSPETLETVHGGAGGEVDQQQFQKCGGRSSVLMQLISCGSMSLKGCGAGAGLGLIGPYKVRVAGGEVGGKGKEKEEFPALKTTSSYHGDRCIFGSCRESQDKMQDS